MTNGFVPNTGAPQGGQSPIMDVWWDLDSWEGLESTYNEGTPNERKSYRLRFKFTNVQVLQSTEPYPFPVAEIFIAYSNPQTSRGEDRWSHFTKSLRDIYGGPFEMEALNHQRMRWAQEPRPIRQPYSSLDEDTKQDWQDRWEKGERPQGYFRGDLADQFFLADALCWVVKEIQGVASVASQGSTEDLFSYIAGKAEGLLENDFYIGLVSDPKVVANTQVVELITDKRLVDFLITTGKIVRDPDGTLHTKAGVGA